MKRHLRGGMWFVASLLVLLLCASSAWGQANRASITGTVTDSSGAVVTGVDVTTKNLSTNVVTSSVTNEDGIYSILNLFPGKYSIHFKKAGFKPVLHPSVTLDSAEVTQLNVMLEVGAVTESVTVTADAPVLQRETSSVGTDIKVNAIIDLPMSIYGGGRFVENFAVALTPGYSPISDPYQSVINGTQAFTKDFTVDGTSATAQIQGDSMEIGPSMEAVQEIQSQTSGLTAENGITNGGVIMLSLKSGTNRFHGSAFGFGHNELLDANTWDNDYSGAPKAKARAWDYGGSLGGPILKNKTYFFGAFERYTQNDFTLNNFASSNVTVPTSDFLAGNFSALLNTATVLGTDTHGNPIYSGAIFNPTDPGAVFVGNIISGDMISAVSKKIVALYQKYYSPGNTNLIQNDQFPSSNSPLQTPNQAVVKIDHDLSQTNRLSGSWVYNHRPRTLLDTGGVWSAGTTDGGPMSDSRYQLVYSHEFRASDAWTIRPNMLNVVNATYNWYWNGSMPTSTGTNWPTTLGFAGTGADNFPRISFGSSVNGVGETAIGNQWQGNYVGGTLILGDTLSWTMGRHTLTFGGDFRAMELNSHGGSGVLNFGFVNNTTGAPSQPYANQVGFGLASFLLGDVQNASETTPFNLYGRRKAMDLFAQDSWKVTPKLTLNLGLRWDATFRLHEKYGHWANFDLTATDPNLGGILGANVYASSGSDSFEKDQDWTNFGPQIGFAYSPFQRWAFRGSFGIAYVPIGIQYWEGVPYAYDPGFRGTNAATASFNWDSGYPGVFTPGTQNTTPPIAQFGIVNIDPRSLRAGYTDNFNIGVQYELTPNTRLGLAYIGNRGHRLQDSGLAHNQGSASQFMALAKNYNGFNWVCSQADATANGVPYPYAGFCAPAFAAIAPYPQIAAYEGAYWYYPDLYYVGLPLGQSYYDSMVVEAVKRTGVGLTFNLNYTLSRQMGDTFGNFGESYDTGGIQDYANLSEAAHTLSPYDQKHVVKGYVAYELPFGHSRRFLSSQGGFVNGLVSNWTLSGLVLYASGQPLTFYSSNYYWYPLWSATYLDFNLTGYNGSQFHQSTFVPPSSGNAAPAGDQYFPASIASNPSYGDLGTGKARMDALRGFGSANENVSILKYLYFGAEHRYALSLRVEFYNVFNRHTFANPDSNIADGARFGKVLGLAGAPRTGQFGLRFTF
jgi:hypothetical protein